MLSTSQERRKIEMAKTTTIRATSRASVKIKDSFYTVEWCEERTIEPADNIADNIEEERASLWETCNSEVDNQIEDILKMIK